MTLIEEIDEEWEGQQETGAGQVEDLVSLSEPGGDKAAAASGEWPPAIAMFLACKDEANGHFRGHDYPGAVESYQAALAAAPDGTAAAAIHNNLAECWLRMSRYADAVGAADSVLALRPKVFSSPTPPPSGARHCESPRGPEQMAGRARDSIGFLHVGRPA